MRITRAEDARAGDVMRIGEPGYNFTRRMVGESFSRPGSLRITEWQELDKGTCPIPFYDCAIQLLLDANTVTIERKDGPVVFEAEVRFVALNQPSLVNIPGFTEGDRVKVTVERLQ